jgi:hypothetical protein
MLVSIRSGVYMIYSRKDAKFAKNFKTLLML